MQRTGESHTDYVNRTSPGTRVQAWSGEFRGETGTVISADYANGTHNVALTSGGTTGDTTACHWAEMD